MRIILRRAGFPPSSVLLPKTIRTTRSFASTAPAPSFTTAAFRAFRASNSTAAPVGGILAAEAFMWHFPDLQIEDRVAVRLSYALSRIQTLLQGDDSAAEGTGILKTLAGGEVKGNPTESEADVAADRSEDDPLPPEKHHTIRMPAGESAPKPTESEEDVRADHVQEELVPTKGKK